MTSGAPRPAPSRRSRRFGPTTCAALALALALGATLLAGVLPSTAAHAATRALVVGADYAPAASPELRLANTLRDARAIEALLRRVRAADVRLLENPTGADWQSASAAFVAQIQPGDVAIVYYAGHAVQVAGVNYFLAADGRELVPMSGLISTIMARARAAVFIIDACRNNPFREAAPRDTRGLRIHALGQPAPAPGGSSGSIGLLGLDELRESRGGLSQFGDLRGSNALVLFSTDPGNVALDGEPGRGSPFAGAVVEQLARRQSLDEAIRRITTDVARRTGGRQSPWRQGDTGFPLFLAGEPSFPVP
ncbi:MAG: caspase family protein [Steroidobacteraceae bacterium]